MSTTAAPHEGIGVAYYSWCTSPLRRYVDLVNQQQLIAAVRGDPAPYAPNDADLFGIVSAFEAAYATYAEFQERLERFWCLRWLQQEAVERIGATVLKSDLLRFDGMPLLTRVAGLPLLERGQRVELDVVGVDEVDLTVEVRLHRLLPESAASIEALDAETTERAEADEEGATTAGPSPDLPQAG